jgi:hypothetical protein
MCCTFNIYYYNSFYYAYAQLVQQQQQQQQQTQQSKTAMTTVPSPHLQAVGVKITSHTNGQNVSVGQLTISGTSTDTPSRACMVYTDWNNTKPFQRVVATGPGGVNDYSRWNYTYTSAYHLITNGTNNLTSKISCLDTPTTTTTNLTKWYSVNVTGIEGLTPEVGKLSSISSVQNNGTNTTTSFMFPDSTVSAAEVTLPTHTSESSFVNSDYSDNYREEKEEVAKNDEKEENMSHQDEDGKDEQENEEEERDNEGIEAIDDDVKKGHELEFLDKDDEEENTA